MGYGNCTEKVGKIPPRNCPGIYESFGVGCGFLVTHTINIYSSPDLVTWHFEREALPFEERPLGIYFRPKVIFNNFTKEFVLWVNVLPPAIIPLASYPNATYYIAVSTSPTGPFVVVNKNPEVMVHGGVSTFPYLLIKCLLNTEIMFNNF